MRVVDVQALIVPEDLVDLAIQVIIEKITTLGGEPWRLLDRTIHDRRNSFLRAASHYDDERKNPHNRLDTPHVVTQCKFRTSVFTNSTVRGDTERVAIEAPLLTTHHSRIRTTAGNMEHTATESHASTPNGSAPSRSTSGDRRVRDGIDRAKGIIASPILLRAIESLAREHGLTPKQVELVAYSTTDVDRVELVTKLGVSTNTVKTRVRHLLRTLDEKSLDSLGKTVLRRALDGLDAPS